jgi:hypothetical protein
LPYELLENFAAGLDVRKSPLTAPAGTLSRLVNAAINPGGEIEKRRAFVEVGTNILTNTFGLAATEATLYAFTRGVGVAPPGNIGIPGVSVRFAEVPNTAADIQQLDYDVFDGKMYLVCRIPSGAGGQGTNPHYYDNAAPGRMVTTQGSSKGYYIRTFQSKIYSVLGKNLYFCSVNDPMDWDAGTGHGFINLALQDADSELLTSLEVYYDKLAIFSTEAIQLWAVDPEPAQNAFTQLLRGTGTSAPRSASQYGTGDVLYLDHSGVRSMKARDSSNSAAVSDIGSPIDRLIQGFREAGASDAYFDKAIALLEPLIGRFWMLFPDQIAVLSYFPGPKITAWSLYKVTFPIDHAVTCGGRVFIRSGNKLYVYGGLDNRTYDNCGVEVRLPFLNGKKPGHNKIFEAIDMSITGTWRGAVAFNVNSPDTEETFGTFTESTWSAGRAELQGYSSHASLRFYNDDALPAVLSNIAVHYQGADEEQ